MKAVIAVFVLGAVGTWASEEYHYHPPHSHVPKYSFKYEVNDKHSSNYYGHEEHRDGQQTHGSYFVHLPDSRLMRVDYYVDEHGYHPTISYEGKAVHPNPPKTEYSAPYHSKDFSHHGK